MSVFINHKKEAKLLSHAEKKKMMEANGQIGWVLIRNLKDHLKITNHEMKTVNVREFDEGSKKLVTDMLGDWDG